MNQLVKDSIINIAIELVCFVALGFLLVSSQVINPSNTIFSFTIFGFTAVILFNLLEAQNKRAFVYAALGFILLFLILWFKDETMSLLIRNTLWFLFISGFTFISWNIMQRDDIRKSYIFPVFVWIVSFAFVYILMTLINIYVFSFYHLKESITVTFYLLQAIKISSIIGGGIGIGTIIVKVFHLKYRNIRAT